MEELKLASQPVSRSLALEERNARTKILCATQSDVARWAIDPAWQTCGDRPPSSQSAYMYPHQVWAVHNMPDRVYVHALRGSGSRGCWWSRGGGWWSWWLPQGVFTSLRDVCGRV